MRHDRRASVRISAIVPTLNEATRIGPLVEELLSELDEAVVVDGGSRDRTVGEARAAGARVHVAAGSSRATALNTGAAIARGDILYFIHADCRPPAGFAASIRDAVQGGADAGCFRLRFDSGHWLLRLSAWCTRLDMALVRFGDQSLFVTRRAMRLETGFDERYDVLEDQELVRRLRRRWRFVVLDRAVVASSRRYDHHGVYRTQLLVYPALVALYRLHLPPGVLRRASRRLLASR